MEATRNKGKLFFSSLSLFLSFSLSLFLSSVVYENNSGRKTRRNSKKKEKKTGIVTFPSTSFFLRCLQKKEKEEIDRNPMTGGLTFLYYFFLISIYRPVEPATNIHRKSHETTSLTVLWFWLFFSLGMWGRGQRRLKGRRRPFLFGPQRTTSRQRPISRNLSNTLEHALQPNRTQSMPWKPIVTQ